MDPVTLALISGGLTIGGQLLEGRRQRRRERRASRTPQVRPFEDTFIGRRLVSELEGYDDKTRSAFGDFQRLASSGQPTIADFLGASFAQGGGGNRARLQQQQVRQAGQAAAFGAYSGYRRHRDAGKQQLLAQLAAGQAQQQQFALGQAGLGAGVHAAHAARPGLGNLISGIGGIGVANFLENLYAPPTTNFNPTTFAREAETIINRPSPAEYGFGGVNRTGIYPGGFDPGARRYENFNPGVGLL